MATTNLISTRLLRAIAVAAALAAATFAAQISPSAASSPPAPSSTFVQPFTGQLGTAAAPRWITIHYRAHTGRRRDAVVLLPDGYRAGDTRSLPLVIFIHGRGHSAAQDAVRMGNLPSLGNFAVVVPDGEGRKLHNYSWGAPGQIADLARMPRVVESALPWVHVDHRRLYAVGGSMGGQETLLLVARYPHLLAGASAVDGVTDFALQYRNWPQLPCGPACKASVGNLGRDLQAKARREVGGTPSQYANRYADRSAMSFVRPIASSCTRLQLWWSHKDVIVMHAEHQEGRLYRALQANGVAGRVDEFVGYWPHTRPMNAWTDLPRMLVGFGLLPAQYDVERVGSTHQALVGDGCGEA